MSDNKSKHFVSKTNTEEADKDQWQTPRALFITLRNEFRFDLDACANNKNKLCTRYFSKEKSALHNEWNFNAVTSAFINPPYSQTGVFLERAAQQAKKHNITVVALVNANTDCKWFSEAVKSANEVRLITGRISFIKPNGVKGGQNSKGQALIVWRGRCKTPCVISMINRDDL